MNPHTLSQLSKELDMMNGLVLKMGGLVEDRLSQAVKALSVCDIKLAKSIAVSDYKVNNFEIQLDAECMKILALHQLVACDLRMVMMALKVITDLERIGDEAQKIARQVSVVEAGGFPEHLLADIRLYGDEVIDIVRQSLDNFARREDNCQVIHDQDKKIDEQCRDLSARMLGEMAKDPNNIQALLAIIWCLRALERVGDHAKNIGEYAVYVIEGVDVRHPAPTKAAHS